MSFLLDVTTNPDTGGMPDSFSFVMFDTNLNLIATADPTGADSIMDFNLAGSNTSTFVDPNFATVTQTIVATHVVGFVDAAGQQVGTNFPPQQAE